MGREFVGEGATLSRGRKGEIILTSADGKRRYRSPTPKSSEYAKTGKQANFEQRNNIRDDRFDREKVSNIHIHVR